MRYGWILWNMTIDFSDFKPLSSCGSVSLPCLRLGSERNKRKVIFQMSVVFFLLYVDNPTNKNHAGVYVCFCFVLIFRVQSLLLVLVFWWGSIQFFDIFCWWSCCQTFCLAKLGPSKKIPGTLFGRDSVQLSPGDWICRVNRETQRKTARLWDRGVCIMCAVV